MRNLFFPYHMWSGGLTNDQLVLSIALDTGISSLPRSQCPRLRGKRSTIRDKVNRHLGLYVYLTDQLVGSRQVGT